MKPIKFDAANADILTDGEITAPMWVHMEATVAGERIYTGASCWKLTLRERLSLLFFGRLWLVLKLPERTRPPKSISMVATRQLFKKIKVEE